MPVEQEGQDEREGQDDTVSQLRLRIDGGLVQRQRFILQMILV